MGYDLTILLHAYMPGAKYDDREQIKVVVLPALEPNSTSGGQSHRHLKQNLRL